MIKVNFSNAQWFTKSDIDGSLVKTQEKTGSYFSCDVTLHMTDTVDEYLTLPFKITANVTDLNETQKTVNIAIFDNTLKQHLTQKMWLFDVSETEIFKIVSSRIVAHLSDNLRKGFEDGIVEYINRTSTITEE